MSYMFIIVIGAVAGWVAGQYVKGSEMGVGIDVAAGAVGSIVAVALSRWLGPASASGLVMSALVAIIGAVGSLFLMRRVMKPKMVPATRPRRRP
jgi:uncharacterized membrane protein YeaQ/YmgE (transglycosylase-associated protein family)